MQPPQVAIVVLNSVGMAINTILLATMYSLPIQRHPVVTTMLSCSVLHSFMTLWPAFILKPLEDQLGIIGIFKASLAGPYAITGLAKFCAAQAILYQYLATVRTSFALSFSLAMLHLAKKSTSQDQPNPARVEWWFRPRMLRHFNLVLCVAPFILSLPVLLVPLPKLIRNVNSCNCPISYFVNMYCFLLDEQYNQMVRIYYLSILALALCAFFATIFYIVRFYVRHKVLLTFGTQDKPIVIRFGFAFLVVFASGIFLLVVVTKKSMQMFTSLAYWSSAVPLVEFTVFSTRREIWNAWNDILRRLFSPFGCTLLCPCPSPRRLARTAGNDSSGSTSAKEREDAIVRDLGPSSRIVMRALEEGGYLAVPPATPSPTAPSFTADSTAESLVPLARMDGERERDRRRRSGVLGERPP